MPQLDILINRIEELDCKLNEKIDQNNEIINNNFNELKDTVKNLAEQINPTKSGDGLIVRVVRMELVVKALIFATGTLFAGAVTAIFKWWAGKSN